MPSTAVVTWLLSYYGYWSGVNQRFTQSDSNFGFSKLEAFFFFFKKKRLARKKTEGAPALISQKFIKVVNIRGSQINLSCLGVEKA